MILEVTLDSRFLKSPEVVSRKVGEEILIVPAHSGMSAEEDVLFTLAGTGKTIWELLDGLHSVQQVIDQVVDEYLAPREIVEADVTIFLEDLVARGMITL